MLNKITIENYRCYSKHAIEFKEFSIAVGKNNAGKSTLVEALRYVSLALNRFRFIGYHDPPTWTELPRSAKGIMIPLKRFGFTTENMFHQYQDPPSKIEAYFASGLKVTVYIGNSSDIFCTLNNSKGKYITNKGEASKLNIEQVNILPQLAAIQKEERLLNVEYVKQNLFSDSSSLHFRNQLLLLHDEYFNKFKAFAEDSWKGLRVFNLEKGLGVQGEILSLIVQDSGFASEIGWMGHGLQIWLQIMWFISRVNENEMIILDEPDVYMHPDLQRKLIRLLQNKFRQTIVSTHSTEIISEVEPENILIIDKTKDKSIFATKVPVVQEIMNSIGSIHNLQLTRLWTSKKLLIVEGDDISILKRFQNILFPKSDEPFGAIPNFDIGGWGGWNYAKGSSMLLKETVDDSIKIYCLFDSDYYTDEEKKQRMEDAKRLNVNLHIWKRKEIENYLIVPSAILRILQSENGKTAKLSLADIEKIISTKAYEFKDNVIHNFADEFQKKDRKLAVATAINMAKRHLTDKLEFRVSGKDLISSLSRWTQDNFQVSLSPVKLAQNMRQEEIDTEVLDTIKKIENAQKF